MNKEIKIADVTLRESYAIHGKELSFQEKIEIGKKLKELGVDIIETAPVENGKSDSIFLHTLAPLVNDCVISCPVPLMTESLDATWEALKNAAHPRLNILAPVSAVQMEYLCHKKQPAILGLIENQVKACKALSSEVELTLQDATRADYDFLCKAIETGILAGADIITICDTAGVMFPFEFSSFLEQLNASVPSLKTIQLSIEYSNILHMAAGCAFASVKAGAVQIKTVGKGNGGVNLCSLGQIFRLKGNSAGITCHLNLANLEESMDEIVNLLTLKKENENLPNGRVQLLHKQADIRLGQKDSVENISAVVKEMGFELSKKELEDVCLAVRRIATKKTESVGQKELLEIVETVLNQVLPVYQLDSFVITSGNIITSSAHVILTCKGEKVEGCSFGDGPIDAAFRSIEQIIARHFELDYFQVNSVTEGAEAMGSVTVKLRKDGKVYPGKGLSTDIVGASIRAYIDALNKICSEEEQKK